MKIGLRFALQGWKSAWQTEKNFKIQLTCGFLVVLTCSFLPTSKIEWIVLLLCIGLVLAVELLNSAIEKIVDIIAPHQNPKAGQIKDFAAGSVLIVALMALIIGCLIIVPKFFH